MCTYRKLKSNSAHCKEAVEQHEICRVMAEVNCFTAIQIQRYWHRQNVNVVIFSGSNCNLWCFKNIFASLDCYNNYDRKVFIEFFLIHYNEENVIGAFSSEGISLHWNFFRQLNIWPIISPAQNFYETIATDNKTVKRIPQERTMLQNFAPAWLSFLAGTTRDAMLELVPLQKLSLHSK